MTNCARFYTRAGGFHLFASHAPIILHLNEDTVAVEFYEHPRAVFPEVVKFHLGEIKSFDTAGRVFLGGLSLRERPRGGI